MKKYLIFVLLLSVAFGTTLFAQTLVSQTPTQVLEGDFTFIKKIKATANGLTMDIAGESEMITEMMTKRLEEATGEKVKSFKKGIMGMEGVMLESISANTYDYYFRVDEIKNKDPERSKITLFVSVGNHNFINSDKYPNEVAASKVWLQKLLSWKRLKEIAIAEAAQQIKLEEAEKQQAVITETATKLNENKANMDAEFEKLQAKLKELAKKKESNDQALLKHEVSIKDHAKNVEEIRAKLQTLLNEKMILRQ